MKRILLLALLAFGVIAPVAAEELSPEQQALLAELRSYPHKLLHESYRDSNWELILRNADGSDPVNLTNTADMDELYPQASPDGRQIVYECDWTDGEERVRDLWIMNIDGSERRLLVKGGRQPAWSPDGKRIAFMRGTSRLAGRNAYRDTKGMAFYDVESGEISEHVNPELEKLMNLSWTPEGEWIVALIVGAWGFNQSIVAIESDGTKWVNFIHQEPAVTGEILGCRPNVSPCGTMVTWALVDRNKITWIEVADIVYEGDEIRRVNDRHVATDYVPVELYHPDWSPDSGLIAYSRGVRGNRMLPARYIIGEQAPGWDIWLVDPKRPEVLVQVTDDGLSNKEPDWVYVAQ